MRTTIITMLLLAAASATFRIAFITLIPAERLPGPLTRGLTHLAPAALAAIAAVELMGVVRDGQLVGNLATLCAMAIVGVIAYRWQNLTFTVITGLVTILAIDLLVLV